MTALNNTMSSLFNHLEFGVETRTATTSIAVLEHPPPLALVRDFNQPNSEVFQDDSLLRLDEDYKAGRDADGVMQDATGLDSTEEHRHVAKVCQAKCTVFDKFAAGVDAAAVGKSDVLIPEAEVRLDADLRLAGNGMGFTDFGLRCLAKYVGIKPGTVEDLLDNGYQDLVPTIINAELDKRVRNWHSTEGRAPRSFLLRKTTDTGGLESIRAVMSGKYGVLDNTETIDILREAFDNDTDDILASHAHHDGNAIILNLLLPDQMKAMPDSDYGVGIAIKNDEIGRYAYSVAPFLFRAVCLNGQIWSRMNSTVSISRKHLGTIDKNTLIEQTRNAIKVALTHGHDMLTQMTYLADAKVTSMQKTVALLCRDNSLTVAHGQAWMRGIEDTRKEPVVYEGTAHLLLNGLTRAAQSYKGETRNVLEEMAGDLLTRRRNANSSKDDVLKRWAAVSQRAEELDDRWAKNYVLVAA